MRATDILRSEHEAILSVLDLLDVHAGEIRAGQPLNGEFAEWVIGFLGQFADRQHHGKEEGVLFPALERHGVPREGGPIAVMLSEHDLARAAIRRMAEATMRRDAGSFLTHAGEYVALLRQHIAKENNVLFAIADRLLSAEDDANALQGFGRVVHETGGVLVRERYLPAVDRWRRTFGR
jgi:hemerythrin-like domain-containing protein